MTTAQERRGPKIGDAASLWNFTPAPGWTKEEAQILKLSLMKLGVGRWMQILDTGLLPGKLIQQLNGQTQRLVGQQSLAAYTGLQVDIDRIRADNLLKKDAERKSGLIIWSGPNPTKKMKEEWQKEAKAKYALTPEQLKEVDEALEEVASRLNKVASGGDKAADNPRQPVISLMDSDPAALSKDQKILLLRRLRQQLAAMVRTCDPKPGPDSEAAAPNAAAPAEATAAAVAPQSDAEAAMELEEPAQEAAGKPTGKKAGGGRGKAASGAGGKGGGRGRAKRAVDADEDAVPVKRSRKPKGMGRKGAEADDMDVDTSSAAAEASKAAFDADLAELQAMGYTRGKAKEALEESGGDLEGALMFLINNCT